MQRIENPPQTTIHDLQPGDIFFFNFYGVPHTGIYAPTPNGQGDIIRNAVLHFSMHQQIQLI